jgi:predicted nucleic acid-binding protein
MRTPDALIAATAVEHDLTLVTRNLQDFKGLRGLRARAPA